MSFRGTKPSVCGVCPCGEGVGRGAAGLAPAAAAAVRARARCTALCCVRVRRPSSVYTVTSSQAPPLQRRAQGPRRWAAAYAPPSVPEAGPRAAWKGQGANRMQAQQTGFTQGHVPQLFGGLQPWLCKVGP